MRRTILALIGAALTGVAAARTLEIVEGAYEVALAAVRMPQHAASSAVFRTCESCDLRALPVNTGTRYLIDGREFALPDFLVAVDGLGKDARESSLVALYYELTTQRVTRINVVTANR